MSDTDYTTDIPRSLAVAAFNGTSWTPDTRADSYTRDYAATLAADLATLTAHATKGGTLDLLPAEFERYRAGYRKRFLAWLASRGRIMSAMITGPSNFPVRQQEKRHRVADARQAELIGYRERALKAITTTLRPDLRPIMAGDDNAVTRLQAELAAAEELQARMKLGNATIRKHLKAGREAQHAALVAAGFSARLADNMLTPNCFGAIGFESYQLSNNSANIRRLKQRLATVSAAKALPDTSAEGVNATLEDCPADNRVRLAFAGKPEVSVRDTLKRAGFRWAPSLGVWQAYRNARTLQVARDVAGVPG